MSWSRMVQEAPDGGSTPRQAVQQLVRYAQVGPPARELPQAFTEFFGPDVDTHEIPGGSTGALFVEWFLFDRPTSSGETPAREYAMASRTLSADQRRAFFDLAETVPGFFEVVGFGPGGMWLTFFPAPGRRGTGEAGADSIWVEEPAAARRLARGDVIWTRLLRWKGRWHLATCCFVLPPSAHDVLRPLARLRPRLSDRAWRLLMGRLQPQFFRDLVAESDDGQPVAPPDAIPLTETERRYYLMEARSLLQRSNLRLALQRYWRVLADDPRDVEARLGVAQVRLGQGRIGAAERAFRSVLADHPDHPVALSGLGRLLAARGASGEASRLLLRLERCGRARPDDLAALGRIALRRGRRAEAVRWFERCVEQAAAARRGRSRATASAAAAEAALEAGWDLLEAGYASEARAFFERAATQAPTRQARASAWHGLGRCLAREGQPLEAAAALLTALRLGVGQPKLWAEVGRLYARANRLKEAEGAYRAAVTRLPGYVEGLVGLSSVLLRQGRLREALRIARRAFVMAPDHPGVLRVMGACQLKRGSPHLAVELLERALRLDPRDLSARRLLRAALDALNQQEAPRRGPDSGLDA
ncbi:MAG TPA: tetratricopeptide repeat protein [Limnochordales bacterium]